MVLTRDMAAEDMTVDSTIVAGKAEGAQAPEGCACAKGQAHSCSCQCESTRGREAGQAQDADQDLANREAVASEPGNEAGNEAGSEAANEAGSTACTRKRRGTHWVIALLKTGFGSCLWRGRSRASSEVAGEARGQNQQDQKDRNEAGFTLIEVLGALVVGSIVFAFAAFGISGGLESARVSGFNESLALLRINIHESYASSRGFGTSGTESTDITQELIDAGAIPQNWMTDDGESVVHNFGGSVSVEGSVSGFSITAEAIPEAVCRKIVSSQLEGWDSVSIGGSEVTELPPTGCEEDQDGVGVNELTFQAH